jgi:8-oxo-dGTP diphosphatase
MLGLRREITNRPLPCVITTHAANKLFGPAKSYASKGSAMRTPLLAVDSVIFFEGGVVLIKRKNPPFQGCYALPGGFVEIGESTEEAVVREAREETGLVIDLVGLVGVYSDPHRDPRGHVVSVCYFSKGSGSLVSGSDARSSGVFHLDDLPMLAFDHDKMIGDALRLYCSDPNQQSPSKEH